MSSGLSRLARRRIAFSLAAFLVLSGAAFCLRTWRAANAALAIGRKAASTAGRIPVSIFALPASHTSFEPVLTTAEFRSAAEYQTGLYVCGSSALFRYQQGELTRSWHAGRELPPHRLSSLAVRTGIAKPELWIATDGGGLVVYDGDQFRQILPEAAALRKISAMLPLRNGWILVGTPSAGLYVTDGTSFRSFHPQFAGTQVTTLAGDKDQFWVGTRNDGAWRWSGGEAVHITQELPDAQVLSITTRQEKTWIGTPVGVVEFSGSHPERRLAEGIFAQALAEHDGALWIGTADQGTLAIPLAAQSPRPQLARGSAESASAIAFARLGDTLAAMTSQLIFDLSTSRPLVKAADTLASGHVTAVREDSRGRLWVGYFDRGLDILTPANSNTPVHMENDVLFCINRIRERPADGTMAVATANGLAVFDGNATVREVLDRKSGLIATHVTDVLFRPDAATANSMVIATPAGLSFLERGSLSSMYAFHGLVNNHVYTLAETGDTLYAGTLGGVSMLKNDLVQASFTTANSQLRQNWITASAILGNELYLGTYGSGVIRFDSRGAVTPFPAFAGHRIEINANAMLATGRALYAGTAGQGLAILRRGQERWQFVSDGLPSGNVTALDERNGHLYVGTDNGLVRISESNLLP